MPEVAQKQTSNHKHNFHHLVFIAKVANKSNLGHQEKTKTFAIGIHGQK